MLRIILLLAACAFGQVERISSSSLSFEYVAPPGWQVYVTKDLPGQEMTFEVKSSNYTWAWAFRVVAVASIVEAVGTTYFRHWSMIKAILPADNSGFTLSAMQEDIANSVLSLYSGGLFTYNQTQLGTVIYAHSYRNVVSSYFTTFLPTQLTTYLEEFKKVKDGFLIRDFASTAAPTMKKGAKTENSLLEIRDLLGRAKPLAVQPTPSLPIAPRKQ